MEAQTWRNEFFRLRLLGRGPGLLQSIQLHIAANEVGIILTASWVEAEDLTHFGKALVMLPQALVDDAQVVQRRPVSRIGLRPEFKDLARLFQVGRDKPI